METIKNYLESMFASYPATQEVLRAKQELFQMMEDKYNELIADGKSDNEAVGIVISEFGNLEEISGALGIDTKTEEFTPVERRLITKDEAREYIKCRRTHSITLGIGVFAFIACVIWPILLPSVLGVACLFLFIAAGVLTIVLGNLPAGKFSYIKEELCGLDYAAETFVKDAREAYRSTHAILLCIGVIFCALCWVPGSLFDSIPHAGGTFLFIVAGIGVLLIVETSSESNTFDKLLGLNGLTKENLRSYNRDVPNYSNAVIDVVMHIFWPLMTCLYLCFSFLTFAWSLTWIIWPLAAVIFNALKTIFRNNEQ